MVMATVLAGCNEQQNNSPTSTGNNPTSLDSLVIHADDTYSGCDEWYGQIEWFKTGTLVVDNGCGIGLMETKQ